MTYSEKLTAILENNWCTTQGEAVLLFKARDTPEEQWPWQIKALIGTRYNNRRGGYGEASAKDSIARDVPTTVIY